MKVGDLVREKKRKFHGTRSPMMGIVVGFDNVGSPIVVDNETGDKDAWYYMQKLEVISEGR